VSSVDTRRQRRLAIVLLGLALVMLLVAVRSGSQPFRVAAVIAVTVGIVWLARAQPGEPAPRWRWLLPAAVTGVGVLLVAAFFLWSWEGFGLIGAILVYLGVGSLLGKARRQLRHRWWPGALVLATCAIAFGVGVTALSPGLPRWAVVTVVLSVLTVPLGVSLLSEVVLTRLAGPSHADPTEAGGPAIPERAGWRTILLVAGAGTTVVVTAALVTGGLSPTVAATVLLVAGLLLWAIVSDNAVDTALVAVGIAVVLAFTVVDAPPGPQHQPAADQPTLVAFGDSYMSGEGAQVYFEGTNQRRVNECRRAPTAYAASSVGAGDGARFPHLAFLACSGARAIHLYERAQYPDEPFGTAGLHQLAHLSRLQEDVRFPVELAVVSIGGNDAGFSMVGTTCLAPGNCDEVGHFWTGNLPHVRRQVRAAYQELRTGLGDDVPVVAVPYPMPLDPDGCDATWLTDAEHAFLARFVTRLNTVIRQEAARAGFWYLDEMETSLEDESLRLCDGPPRRVGVNFIGLRSVGGTLEQVLTPTNWFHNSLHPNETGHGAMARTFVLWLDEQGELSPVPETGPGREQAGAVEAAAEDEVEPPCLLTETGDEGCDAQARDWAIDRTVELLWPAGAVALLGLLGVWGFWLGVVSTWRVRRRTVDADAAV
jgi:hypothetical protein